MGNGRIFEIDLLRTIAITLMIIFHIVYDLNEFAGIDINYQSGFWYWEGRIAALIFIFISGISSGFSRDSFKRGVKVLGLGMGITIVTYIVIREQYIRFGILHLLGTGMILFPLLKRINNYILLLLSGIFILISAMFNDILVNTSLLLPLGIMHSEFNTVDYYPIIPYLSAFIMGVIVYKIFYRNKQSFFKINYENRLVTKISKNSLSIYLMHQPAIIGTILLFRFLGGE
ncbi:hypothetical protein CACET_c26090 [Clostridium aceticum]|uniref:Uncharacterized protein n=1 Tax=Clostridium aceticum TaxID=84022 RepID=A0A0D8IAF0_9CLOT|nr:heparan-alpha-glucosaminide N-acetyltransferase [Clostridium aceticum]AKL96054.1 hypothetical protein CACET_c26090 [Clostridium aceticum]KJF27019.1 hypothetical protein TZ02_09410 [Clostridium aceticum]